MSNELTYSNEQELQALAKKHGLIIPATRQVENPDQPLEEVAPTEQEQLTDENLGAVVAEKIARFAPHGYKPTFEEAIAYRKEMKGRTTDAWGSIAGAVMQTAEDLGAGAYELAGDAITLKVPKVVGSVVEGAALGTKNWMYMYDEAQYNEDSFLHKMLFDTNRTDEEYYFNLLKSLEARQAIEKDQKEGILLPREIEIGGTKLDLWNPAVVQAISYVADPSWISPNLGIEATIAKSLRGASTALSLSDQLTQAGMWASKKASTGAGSIAEGASKVASTIVKVEDDLLRRIKETTGIDAFIGTAGNVVDKNDLGRGAMASAGLNQVRIPAWGFTTLTWGATKIVETGARALELGAKLTSETPKFQGMRLSERMAMESTNPTVRALSGTWAKTGSPLVEWAGNSMKTSLHSGMYGGAFGFMFGGEEGFYNGIGSGFVIGGAFHQIGALHNAVAGGDAPRDVQKNFLWATSHYDYHNQEGTFRLLENVAKEGGDNARLQVMADIAASERLQRDVKRLILTEDKIRKMMTDEEWNAYEREMLSKSDEWGGVAFRQSLNGQKVTIINADRATTSAVKEELFHTLMMDERYGASFHREAVHSLIGTEDDKGALHRMPKEQAVRLLESFKESYLNLESDVTARAGGDETYMGSVRQQWEEVITNFKNDRPDGRLSKLYEEFLASYWNRFIEDKPIDYLLKGGDLGLLRNTIQKAKDSYLNIMHQDLVSAGANFKWGNNPDHFFLDQTTKQRIRIPKLEKLMEHFVREASKEMYSGWVQGQRQVGTLDKAFANQLEHMFANNADGSVRMLREDEVDKQDTEALKGAIEEIAQLPREARSMKITVVGGNSDGSNFSFAKRKPAKKDKDKKPKGGTTPMPKNKKTDEGWDAVARQLADEGERLPRTGLTQEQVKTAERTARDMEADDAGGWSTDKRKYFWESVWNGNPRIKLTGVASARELAVLAKHLPDATVQRFKELNSIIEMSRMGQFSHGVSNLLTAEVMTRTKEKESGERIEKSEGQYFSKKRNFIPVEINLYFERKESGMKDGVQQYKVGKAQLLVKTIDHDALITRVNYAWNDWNAKDMDYKMVRRMFGTKENLYVAVKDLLSRYSNSEIKEGGARIFEKAGAPSKRDAGHMRDIVNAVIGFHPTKEMVRRGEYTNPWLNLQRRSDGKKVSIPTVMTDFNMRRVGTVRSIDGEGFYYDHDNAFVRSQYNHSPAKTTRDHEGNPMSLSERTILKNTLYRNKDGEILSVYSLDKFNNEHKRRSTKSVFDYVDDGIGRAIDESSPRLRGRQYYSESGWLHYTPDMAEASMLSNGSMRTGYIDTQSHLDISQIPFNTSIADALEVIASRVSQITNIKPEQVLKDFSEFRDINGNLIGDRVGRTESILNTETDILDNWLFTKDFSDYFKRNGIQSVEYVNENPLTGNVSTAVAVWDGGRFIENTSRRSEANYFAFSPAKKRDKNKPKVLSAPDRQSKTLNDILQERISKTVGEKDAMKAFLEYEIDEDGNTVSKNEKLITEEILEDIISTEYAKWEAVTKGKKGNEAFTEKSIDEIKAQLKPFIIQNLRSKMQFAPNAMLDRIADVAMSGITTKTFAKESVNTVTQEGKVSTKDLLVLKDTVLLRLKKHWGVSANKIEETGIPMLAHIAEMTEAEFQIVKAIPEYLTALKQGKGAEWATENAGLLDELYGKHGGPKKFLRKFDNRQKDIFFLLDKQITGQVNLESGGITDVFNSRKLRDLFAEKSREYLFETLRTRKMTSAQEGGLRKSSQRYRDIDAEMSDVRAKMRMYTDEARAILTEEFNERIIDTLTALNIDMKMGTGQPDDMIVEKVRASLYSEAKRGFLKLGTPEAIQRSVELYYEYEKLGGGKTGKSRVIDTKLALKKGLLEALNELEKKGFVGISWSKRERQRQIIDGKSVEMPHKIYTRNGTEREVFNLWDFEGSHHKIIEEGFSYNESVLRLIDMRDGSSILSKVVKKDSGLATKSPSDVLRTANINEFIRESTVKLNQMTPSLILAQSRFGKVIGPMKNFILTQHLTKNKLADPANLNVFNYDNWDVYKSGDTFVAYRRYEGEGETAKLALKVADVQKQLDNGNIKIPTNKVDKKGNPVFAYKKATFEEQVKLRTQLTELKNLLYTDRGVVLQIDETGAFTTVKEINSIQEMNDTLRKVANGGSERMALEKYVEEMYRGFNQIEVKHKEAQQKLLARVLSDKPDGNLAKIKALESLIRESETQLKTEVSRRLAQLKLEKKTDKFVTATAIEAYQSITRDIDSSRKAVENTRNKILAVQHHLYEMGAFPEFEAMTPQQKDMFLLETEKFQDGNELIANALPMNAGEQPVVYVQRLRNELMKYNNEYAVAFRRNTELTDLVNGAKEGAFEAKEKARFLVEQYLRAKGVKFTKKFFEGLFDVTKKTDADGAETGLTQTTIRVDRLRQLGVGKAEPTYLADVEGVFGKRERYETIDDLRTAFLEGMMDTSDNWRGVTGRKVNQINALIEQARAIQEKKTKPKEPVRKKGQSDDNFELEMTKYQERLRAWEGGYGFLLPAEGVKNTLSDTTGSGRPDKKQEIDKKKVIKDRSQYDKAVRDANYDVAKKLEEVTGSSRFLLEEVMASGKRKATIRDNPEYDFTEQFDTIVNGSKLKLSEEVFAKDPVNKAFIEELQGRLTSGEITEAQVIDEIRRETMLSRLGEDGRNLLDADLRLEEAEKNISIKQSVLDDLAYQESINKNGLTAEQLLLRERATKELDGEMAKRDALRNRIDTIIAVQERTETRNVIQSLKETYDKFQRGIEDKEAQIEFIRERMKDNKETRNRTRHQYENQWSEFEDMQKIADLELEIESLRNKSRDVNKQINDKGGLGMLGTDKEVNELIRKRGALGMERDLSSVQVSKYSDPAFMEIVSRIRQRQKNVEAIKIENEQRYIARRAHAQAIQESLVKFVDSFDADAKKLGYTSSRILVTPNNPRTRLLYQAYPSISYDLYGTAHPLDWSGTGYHIGTTEKGEQILRFESSNDPAYKLYQQEREQGRKVFFLADYMHYARQRAEWHRAHPDQAITAEDASLISFLVPQDVYQIPQSKMDSIAPEAIAEQQRIQDGIMDKLAYGDNKERFIRAFAEDALRLVSGSMDSRAKAYQRINGLSADEYNAKIANMTEEQVKAMLMNREVIENAMYWISGSWISMSEKSRKKYMKEVETKDGRKKAVPFTTDMLPIQTLIEMEGFRKVLDESMSSFTKTSMFDGMPMAKTEYEAMPNQQRMDLDVTTVQRLALENDAGMLRYQAQIQAERQGKPMWFPDRVVEAEHTGYDGDFHEVEKNRVSKILATTMATEASVQRFKGEVTTLVNKRPLAVKHMLSLDDGLKFNNLSFDAQSNEAFGANFRESADGRYIIQRQTVTARNGVQSEKFNVFFVGEKIPTKDGAPAYEVGTTLLGTFENTTQAQVMARVFEDDILKVKRLASAVEGGADKYDPLRVLDTILPRAKTGVLIESLNALPAFSQAVVMAYDKNKGNPMYSKHMRRMLGSFGRDFGEMQLLRFEANGRIIKKEMVITPTKEGILTKYFDRTMNEDGQVLWTEKKTKAEDAQQSNEAVQESTNKATGNDKPNPASDTKAPDLEAPSVADNIVTQASTFTVTSTVQKEGQVFEQWQTLKNKLNYQIIRSLDASGKRDIFKLFNPASLYMGAHYNEQDAVDQIVEAEFLARRK